MDREGRLPDDDDGTDEDFSLEWAGVDDPATEGDDVLDLSDADESSDKPLAPHDVPWDELAEDGPPRYEQPTGFVSTSSLIEDDPDDEDNLDDEAPPHGDPLEHEADEAFDDDRPSARMDSLQDALASIRERVQNLSSSVEAEEAAAPRAGGGGGAGTGGIGGGTQRPSELSLYRQATDDRTLRELQRHSGETEELLRRMSALMQDLSLDLRSIVDAARRAIDQTSEQAESSVELGRLLGDRIEQLDEQLSGRFEEIDDALGARFIQTDESLGGRFDALDEALGERVEHLDRVIDLLQRNVGRAFDNMQSHLDKRLSKIEQRSGVGLLREDIGELRADIAALEGGGDHPDLQERLDEVGGQLDRTLEALASLVEGAPDSDDAVVEEVVSAIKAETESAVEPFRTEVEELGRQLSEALEREDQLTQSMLTLTEEVQRLGDAVEARAGLATLDDDQVETIAAAVITALGTAAVEPVSSPSRARSRTASKPRRPAPKPEPVFDEEEEDLELEAEYDEFEEDLEPEPPPPPPPAPKTRRGARRKRADRPVRARPLRKADIKNVEPEPDLDDELDTGLDVEHEVDPFEALEQAGVDALDLPYAQDDEEPIRRARGRSRTKSAAEKTPPAKGRRARSSK